MTAKELKAVLEHVPDDYPVVAISIHKVEVFGGLPSIPEAYIHNVDVQMTNDRRLVVVFGV